MKNLRENAMRLFFAYLPMIRQDYWLVSILALGLYLAPLQAEETQTDEAATESAESEINAIDESEAMRVGALNHHQIGQLALADEVEEREVVWLDVTYPEEDAPRKVLALEQRPRVPKNEAQGAVLLLHDLDQHANWPFLIRTLRRGLPEAGWFTLSVNLPRDVKSKIPERSLAPKQVDQVVLTEDIRQRLLQRDETASGESSTDQGADADGASEAEESAEEALAEDNNASGAETDNDADESVDIDLAESDENNKSLTYEEMAKLHIEAAMSHIRQKGYRNVIMIGHRSGANVALEHIKEKASSIPPQGFALVMIDPRLALGYQQDIGNALGQRFRAPVLDVINHAELDQRVLAAEREAGARIAEVQTYRQMYVKALESDTFQEAMLRRIESWLKKYAPGMSAKAYPRR